MAGYGGIHSYSARDRIPGDTGRRPTHRETTWRYRNPGRSREIKRGDTGRYGEMREDARRYGAIEGDTAKESARPGLFYPR